ncbi:hypothetical protein [Pseudoalteromonas aurantia]|uniref:Virion protein n=1 Tax=Pseudoalteromonas aurantia TaxID=43654 RepID=A0A5S3V1L5_9GAMM|nr:hypothetical protein [Pseudoalteromonas aurantia]TMO64444.1 hypothetical protein CWC19_18405 [Pseudoalteromonas aurantia]TMO75335.1 hypothetical protein CWC20_08415 [Pseudoalteromonas aurantia]
MSQQKRVNRNVRNNNPMNLREDHRVDYDWVGEAEEDWDPEFEEFISPEYGFRAGYRTLMTYRNHRGLDTVAGIIGRWAPDSENDTPAYIAYIREKLGIHPNVTNFWDDTVPMERYPDLMYWMAEKEGAKGAYSIEQIERGIALA